VVKVFEGQEEIHLPSNASWPDPLQVRQKSAASTQVLHEELQANDHRSAYDGTWKSVTYECNLSCPVAK